MSPRRHRRLRLNDVLKYFSCRCQDVRSFLYDWALTLTHSQSTAVLYNALITMAHKITIYLSITNLPPNEAFLCQLTARTRILSASFSCSHCPNAVIMLIVLLPLHLLSVVPTHLPRSLSLALHLSFAHINV